MGAADDLAAELDQPAVGEFGLFDASADPVPGLDDEDVGSAGGEVACGGETGQAGTQHDDVVVHGGVPSIAGRSPGRGQGRGRGAVPARGGLQSRTRQCSGFQPISTRSPPLQRSSLRERTVFCSSTDTVTPGASSMR